MVAQAVTRAWQASLAASPPTNRSSTPEVLENARSPHGVWKRPVGAENVQVAAVMRDAANDDADEDPSIQVDKRDDIVPRRPGAVCEPVSDQNFWSSHLFWKGIVVGAVSILLVKMVIAIQAPQGVDWYGF